MRAGLVVFSLVSCAPDFAYTRVLGEHRFDLTCPRGFGECAAMAGQLCATGYNVETTKSGNEGSGVIVRCNPPAPPEVVRSECPPEKVVDAAPKPPTCAADYQCTAPGTRCVNGGCAIVPKHDRRARADVSDGRRALGIPLHEGREPCCRVHERDEARRRLGRRWGSMQDARPVRARSSRAAHFRNACRP